MKKFIISSDVLKPALKMLGQAVNKKTTIPVLQDIHVKVSKDEVELITSDVELTIACKCVAETGEQEPFELLIPFDFLDKVISVTKSMPVTIEHPSARKAKLICDNDVYEINSLDKLEDLPKTEAIPKRKLVLLNADFVHLLTKAMLTTAKNDTHPAMTRVCLDIQETETNLASTDAYFLFKHKVAVTAEPEQIMFSAKMAKAIEGMSEMELTWNAKLICLKSDKVTIWCKRHDDKYPNYKSIIPNYEPTLELQKQDMVDALNKACISSNATKTTNLLLKKESGFIHFETDDPDLGRKIHVKIPGEYKGEVEKISVNARKLQTIMDQVEAQKIRLHIHSHDKAMLISTEENEDYLGLLMPLLF